MSDQIQEAGPVKTENKFKKRKAVQGVGQQLTPGAGYRGSKEVALRVGRRALKGGMQKEEKMTDAEMAKREKIVKSMKKNFKDFRKRYGDRAKEVMYATATKMANEEVQTENYVHVRTYDNTHDDYISAGVKAHKGTTHAHTDKGAVFKFDSKDNANKFKQHINKNKKIYADDVNESTNKKLGDYIEKASEKVAAHSQQLAKHKASGNFWLARASQQMIDKRTKGIKNATQLMQREEKEETPKMKYKKMRSKERFDARTKEVDQNYPYRSDN